MIQTCAEELIDGVQTSLWADMLCGLLRSIGASFKTLDFPYKLSPQELGLIEVLASCSPLGMGQSPLQITWVCPLLQVFR